MLLLHQKLYQNEKIAYIDTYEYLNTLLPVVLDSYAIKSKIRINNYAQSLKLYLDTAIPLGLIVNEIITNCVKYAFDSTSDPQIDINLYIENKELIMVVKDNGQGFLDLGLAKNKSFGFKLITSMCRQLDAIFEIANDNGAVCTIKIKNYKLYEQR
jgi:two-component sensor histidine kinase